MRHSQSLKRETTIRLVALLLIGAMLFTLSSCMTPVPETTPDAAGTVSASGGEVTVDDPSSPICGVCVQADAGAFDASTAIELRASTKTLPPPDGFSEPVSPCIEIEASSDVSAEGYVTLNIPIDPAITQSIMGLDDSVGQIHTKSVSDMFALVATSVKGAWDIFHPVSVAEHVVSFILPTLQFDSVQTYLRKENTPLDPMSLPPYTVPDFDPALDRLDTVNRTGYCAGMSFFAAWYWEYHRSEKRLLNRFTAMQADDLANAAQGVLGIGDGTKLASCDSESRDIYEIVETMRKSGKPLPVNVTTSFIGVGHTVLAFKWTGQQLLCMDPNAPIVCPPAKPAVAVVVKQQDGNWQCNGADGQIYKIVSKANPVKKFTGSLNNIYEHETDPLVEISFVRATNKTNTSAPIHPGDRVELTFRLRVQGHSVNYVEMYPEAALARDHSHLVLASSTDYHMDPLNLPFQGTRDLRVTFSIPEDAPSGDYDCRAEVVQYLACRKITLDVTGNGPNSGMQSGMWIKAFTVEEVPRDITITQPTEGTTWTAGTSQDITWSRKNSGQYVKIQYSTDNGSSWTSIADSTSNDGTFSWAIPAGLDSTQCKIKISSNAYATVTDTSLPFTIEPGDILNIEGAWDLYIFAYEAWAKKWKGNELVTDDHWVESEQSEQLSVVITSANEQDVIGNILFYDDDELYALVPIVSGSYDGQVLSATCTGEGQLTDGSGCSGSYSIQYSFRLVLDSTGVFSSGSGMTEVEVQGISCTDQSSEDLEFDRYWQKTKFTDIRMERSPQHAVSR